jgi:putative PIN family toxin of toxin-antitoxin system
MRIVLDTNVLLSGLIQPRNIPGRIVKAWQEAQFELVVSHYQLVEIGRVLAYPKIQTRLQWDEPKIERFLKQIMLRSLSVELPFALPAVPRDDQDAPILAALLASDAHCLVTGDRDLLSLRDRYPIETPSEFARRLFP